MTRAEDSYASIKGNVANQVVALYKALGGGWEAQTGKAFLSESVAQQMIDRNDWGGYLDEQGRQLPEIYIPTPEEKEQQEDKQQEEQQ
jgi:hypothetical protein